MISSHSRLSGLCLVLVATTALSTISHAQAENVPKWDGHIEAEGKWGSDRSLGEAGLFIPVWQNESNLLFTDLRARFADDSNSEGNFGLGFRHMLNDQWIVGGYGFYDRRHTPHGNNFNQATLGLEALSERFELRLNGYIPENEEKDLGGRRSVVDTSGANIRINHLSGASERALPGFDAEAGVRFDLGLGWETQIFGGGYHFEADGYDKVAGPRGRIEFSYDNVPLLGEGSRFTVGVEAQTDDARGDQAFALARLRVPFGIFHGDKSRPQLNGLERRMTDRITRDVDVVTNTKAGGSIVGSEAAAITLEDGTQVANYTVVRAGDNLGAVLTTAGANSLVVADGSNGTINVFSTLSLAVGQSLIGGGTALSVTGNSSGVSLPFILPGSRPTIEQQGSFIDGLRLGNNSTLRNVTFVDGTGDNSIAITAYHAGTRISDVTLRNWDIGYDFSGPGTHHISNSQAENNRLWGLSVSFDAQVTAENMRFENNGQSDVYLTDAGARLEMNNSLVTNSNRAIEVNGGTLALNNNRFDAVVDVLTVDVAAPMNTLSGTGNTVSFGPTVCGTAGANITGSITFEQDTVGTVICP